MVRLLLVTKIMKFRAVSYQLVYIDNIIRSFPLHGVDVDIPIW